MSANTKDKNIFKSRKINSTFDSENSSVSISSTNTNNSDIFNFKVLDSVYDLIVDFDNIAINSEQVKFSCCKEKISVDNDFIKVTIVKTDHSFKVFLLNPKIEFADNSSGFQLKTKSDYLIVSISNPFKISVNKDYLFFSSTANKVVEENNYYSTLKKLDVLDLKDNNKLIISEEKKRTFLPYTVSELVKKLESNRYKNIDELIETEFTVPNEYYKFPIIARYREGYNLIRLKEHGTIKKAINTGLELMLNFNLNPAIITACKSLEQLNIYLDCLEENELHKFNCFEIIYEVTPTISVEKK